MEHPDDDSHGVGEIQSKQDDEVSRREELKKSLVAKLAIRQSNLNPERPDASALRTLDSSIKRNTAVIKKLKQINEEQRENLLDELVAAICDAKLKSSDIQAAVQVCSLLHQRYKDFSPTLVHSLLGNLQRTLMQTGTLKAMKKRSALKLLLELFFDGVIEDTGILVTVIKDLASLEHLKDRDLAHTNLSLLATFARQARYFIGLPHPGEELVEEFFKGLNVTADHKKVFKKAFNTYHGAVVALLRSEHTSLRQLEHENAKILNAKE